MAICIYSTVTINQLITNTVAANSKFKTEIAKAQFLKKYEFWGPCNIKSMVRIMVKSLCVVGLVLENWYLICGQISCLHIATHFHTLTFYRNGVIFEAGWHPPGRTGKGRRWDGTRRGHASHDANVISDQMQNLLLPQRRYSMDRLKKVFSK